MAVKHFSFGFLFTALIASQALAGQVPNPINAPASIGSNDLLQANGTQAQQAADSHKVAPSGTIVGTTDTQTLTNKSIDASEINSGTLNSARLPTKDGLALGYVNGNYYTNAAAALSTQAVVANTLYAIPFELKGTANVTFTKISIDVTTLATGNCELGVYNNSSGVPGSLLVDAGNVSTGGTGQQEITGQTITMSPGWYWLAVGCNAAPTLESQALDTSMANQYGLSNGSTPITRTTVSWTYSANNLPANFGTATTGTVKSPLIYLRL